MPEYNAPLRDMRFVMDELLDMTGSYAAYGLEDATPDLVSAILEEGAKFTNQVLSPLNTSPPSFHPGGSASPPETGGETPYISQITNQNWWFVIGICGL